MRAPFALLSAAALLTLTACHRLDPGSTTQKISAGGRDRTFVLHVPASAPAAGTRMLILALHGNGGQGVQQEDLTGFSALSDRDGFVVIYPDGIDKSWADGRGTTDADMQGVDDVGFLRALIDWAVQNQGVDPKNVHATGHSNGGMMASRLGCDLSDKIASIGPNAAELPELVSKTCAPVHPMSVMTFHGTDDPFVPYGGGELPKGAGGVVLGAEAARTFWAEKAGCAATSKTTGEPDRDPSDGTTVDREDSQNCKGGAEVVLFTVHGGGHTWPSGHRDLPEALVGKVTRDVSASELLIDFFAAHTLP
ncbi:MAG: PHB depolymerase family esterase [Byssovorax sp.]